jgi:hypothetical protein
MRAAVLGNLISTREIELRFLLERILRPLCRDADDTIV